MSVIPCPANLFHEAKELHQFLLACQKKSQKQGIAKIASISQEIPPLDPLAVFQAIRDRAAPFAATSEPLHFYFENRSNQESIVAIDAAVSLKLAGKQRFYKAQKFIDSCLANTIISGKIEQRFAGPHFFSSFTFFADKFNSNNPFPSATIFLPRWQISLCQSRCLVVANLEINSQVNLDWLVESLGRQFNLITSSGRLLYCFTGKANHHQFLKQDSKKAKDFKLSVSSALKSIQANQFSKIVLSQAVDVVSPIPFNLVDSLDNLRHNYPDCYIFSISNGKGKNFIGASPERLISIYDHQLVTDALAGSAPRGQTPAEDADLANQLLSSEKERREHNAVSEFIIQRLCQLGLELDFSQSPQLLKLSNIQHLWTPIKAALPADVNPLDIIAKLHPTPAVAGVPSKIACEQIRHYETFDRSLYAAPLGWIDYQGNSEFIVGIRSALIAGNHARLYAGAGIVAGSDPNKELAEINLKLMVLLKALV